MIPPFSTLMLKIFYRWRERRGATTRSAQFHCSSTLMLILVNRWSDRRRATIRSENEFYRWHERDLATTRSATIPLFLNKNANIDQ
jgi:hypothetical protein